MSTPVAPAPMIDVVTMEGGLTVSFHEVRTPSNKIQIIFDAKGAPYSAIKRVIEHVTMNDYFHYSSFTSLYLWTRDVKNKNSAIDKAVEKREKLNIPVFKPFLDAWKKVLSLIQSMYAHTDSSTCLPIIDVKLTNYKPPEWNGCIMAFKALINQPEVESQLSEYLAGSTAGTSFPSLLKEILTTDMQIVTFFPIEVANRFRIPIFTGGAARKPTLKEPSNKTTKPKSTDAKKTSVPTKTRKVPHATKAAKASKPTKTSKPTNQDKLAKPNKSTEPTKQRASKPKQATKPSKSTKNASKIVNGWGRR